MEIKTAKDRWETERLYLDGDAFYQDLIAAINSARTSVDMEVYTFEPGMLAGRLCNSFEHARNRGVHIRLIFDHWGSSEIHNGLYQQLQKAGVRVRIFRGLPWRLLPVTEAGLFKTVGHYLREVPRRVKALNRGVHRKVTIIDGSTAWISSMNVTDVHLREVYGDESWMDAGLRVSGGEVQILSNAFKRAFDGRSVDSGDVPRLVRLNNTRFRRGAMNREIRRRIQQAAERVWIQNPYFLPPRRILRELCAAAARGIDVCILIPLKNDHPFIRWMSLGMLRRLLKSGVSVMEHKGAFAHKKVFIVDEAMFLGSMNFNYRSFLHDLEVEVAVTHPSSKEELEGAFRREVFDARKLTLRWLREQPLWLRLASRLLFFFRYWC